jgi:hypothetical protein
VKIEHISAADLKPGDAVQIDGSAVQVLTINPGHGRNGDLLRITFNNPNRSICITHPRALFRLPEKENS